MGLVHGDRLPDPVMELVHQVRRDGQVREAELVIATGRRVANIHARVAPLTSRLVVVLVDDRTDAHRIEAVRRDFVANVSHELKTPVGGISLLAEAVLGAKDDPAAVERFAERILVESSRLTRLVQEIVDLSRLQVADTLHEPELVDLGVIVAEAVDRVRVAAESRRIELSLVAEDGLRVFGDAELLSTAVTNLVTNAVNYSGSGTRVGIGVRRAGDTVEVTVTDQGVGIPPAEQERIFERFYRVDAARSRATGGTGLGLAIVKHILRRHRGHLLIESELGQGTTVTVYLPAPEHAAGAR
jgi:two-component system sensor histidine kinase SenX3